MLWMIQNLKSRSIKDLSIISISPRYGCTRNIFHTNVTHLFDLFDRLRLDIELLRTQRLD